MVSKANPAACIMLSVFISMGFISSHGRLHMDRADDKDSNPEVSPNSFNINMEEAPAPGDLIGFGSGPECSPGCVPGDIIPDQTVSMLPVLASQSPMIPTKTVLIMSRVPPSPKTSNELMCGPGCIPACVPVWDIPLQGPVLLCYGNDPMAVQNFKSERYHKLYAAVRSADMMNEAINYIASEPTRPQFNIASEPTRPQFNIASEPTRPQFNIASEPTRPQFKDHSQP